MLTWQDILEFFHNGNPTPSRRVENRHLNGKLSSNKIHSMLPV